MRNSRTFARVTRLAAALTLVGLLGLATASPVQADEEPDPVKSFSVHASIPSPSGGELRIDTDFELTCMFFACVGLSLAHLQDPAVKLNYRTLLFAVGGLSDWGTNGTTVIGVFGWNMNPFLFASYSMAVLHVDDKSSVGAGTDEIDIMFLSTAFRTLGIPDGVIDYAGPITSGDVQVNRGPLR